MLRLRAILALEQNVLVLSSTVLLLMTSLFTWYLVLPLYFRDLGASDAQVGLAYSLLTISFTLVQFAGGLITERHGRKLPIVLPTFAFAPLYALAGAARNWVVLLGLLLLTNSLSAIQWPAFISLLAESVPESQRGRAFGAFNVAIGLGMAVGPGLGAELLTSVGLRQLIYSTAVISLICAVARSLALRETMDRPSPVQVGALRRAFNPDLRWFLAAGCLFALIYNLTLWGPFPSLHAKDAWELSKPQINRLFSIGGLAAVVASIIGGRLADRYGARDILIASCLGHVLAILPWALAGMSPLGLALFIMANAGLKVGFVAYDALLSQLTPRSRGAIVGLFGTVTGGIGALGPLSGTYLRMIFGSAAPFWAALGLGLGMAFSLRSVSKAAGRLIYSIGHSTRSLDELVALLAAHKVEALVDVRRFPRSRHNPQFNREAIEIKLPQRGIEYHWLGETLGGFRGGYTDYMSTEDFERGLAELEEIAEGKHTACMCAEKLFFRCHRRFIADALVKRGWRVLHIIEEGREPYQHKLRVEDESPSH